MAFQCSLGDGHFCGKGVGAQTWMLFYIPKDCLHFIYSAIYSAKSRVLMLFQRFQNAFEHEVNEDSGIGFGSAVIVSLVALY